MLITKESNPRDRTLELPSSFRYMLTTSVKNHLSLAQGESLPYRFGATFVVVLVLIYLLREFPLSVATSRFEFRCQSKQLLLLY